MANRRIQSNVELAPVQQISVNPNTEYQAKQINMLTRLVTGEKDHDTILNGVDVFGKPSSTKEELGETILSDTFASNPFPSWQANNFIWDSDKEAIVAVKSLGMPNGYFDIFPSSALMPRSSIRVYQTYKIVFNLINVTNNQEKIGKARGLWVSMGGVVKYWKYPKQQIYSFYLTTESTEPLKIALQIDSNNQYSPDSVFITDILVQRVVRSGEDISAITDPDIDENNIPDEYLRPHLSAYTTKGVLVKDEAMINCLSPESSNDSQPSISLVYGNELSWIKRNPFSSTAGIDFEDPVKSFLFKEDGSLWDDGVHLYTGTAGKPPIASGFEDENVNGEYTQTTSYYNEQPVYQKGDYYISFNNDSKWQITDGDYEDENNILYTSSDSYMLSSWVSYTELGSSGDVSTEGRVIRGGDVKWAYICLYYSYMQSAVPNKAYIGLAREEQINDPIYGEDYMILGKVRFVTPNVVDAILYQDRSDMRYVDATKVSYLYLSNREDWEYRPSNVSIALDLLASRKPRGVLLFKTQKQFEDWISNTTPCGIGYGVNDRENENSPDYGWDRTDGADPYKDANVLACVLQSSKWYYSRFKRDDEADPVQYDFKGMARQQNGVPVLIWEELTSNEFTVNWEGNDTEANNWQSVTVDVNNNYNSVLTHGPIQTNLVTAKTNYNPEDSESVDRVSFLNPSDDVLPGTRILNPFNPTGLGLVRGPTIQDIVDNNFLRADGQWRPASNAPTGSIIMYAADRNWNYYTENDRLLSELEDAPGWLLCAGQEFPITTFTKLYKKIGNKFGGTPGSTYKLPDMRNKYAVGFGDQNDSQGNYTVMGASQGANWRTLITSNLPSHNHSVSLSVNDSSDIPTNTGGVHSHAYKNDAHVSISLCHNKSPCPTSYYIKFWTPLQYFYQGGDRTLSLGYRTENDGSHSHTIPVSAITSRLGINESNVGSNVAFDNRPLSLVLGFIIKI